jgi:hypothetical protein
MEPLMTRWSIVSCALVCLVAAEASADPGRGVTEERAGLTYEFDDDPLLALPAAPSGLRLRGGCRPHRTQLIRPRLQFVDELMSSIEGL